MAEYLSPGVFIEEIPGGPSPIQGVSTTTVGFVGKTVRGAMRAQLVTSWLDFQRRYGGLTDPGRGEGYLPYAVKGFFENGGQRAYIARAPVDAVTGAGADILLNGTKVLRIAAIGPGRWGERVVVKFSRAAMAGPDRPWFALSVFYYDAAVPQRTDGDDSTFLDPDVPANLLDARFVAPTQTERYDNLSFDPAAPNYFATAINPVSTLISSGDAVDAKNAAIAGLADAEFKATVIRLRAADGAAGGAGELAADDISPYVGVAAERPEDATGLQALASIPDIAMLCIPDQAMTGALNGLATALIEQCEALRSRVAILGADPATPPASLRPSLDTSYAATYFPWITIAGPGAGAPLDIPALGHVCGMIARTDNSRGVWKAPANEALLGPLVRDVGDRKPLATQVTDELQAVLNPRGVNCLRDFRAQRMGVRVWGARTHSSQGEWRYLNVRRLFIYVEQSIYLGSQWVVFEPNDAYTWNRVVSSVNGFLNGLWRNGGLVGDTPEQAYRVACDRTTMTDDDIANGRLVCTVAIAPVKPAEFVIFRFSQKTADAAPA